MPGILVGVDGSDDSRRALAWAMREAAQHHVPLTVMTVHPDPVRPVTGIYWGEHLAPEDSRNLELARASVEQFVDKVADEIGETVPDITVNAVTGDPAAELIKASVGADLLVVGSRGFGEFARLLMGSVSSKVVHHAAGPVAVIRGSG